MTATRNLYVEHTNSVSNCDSLPSGGVLSVPYTTVPSTVAKGVLSFNNSSSNVPPGWYFRVWFSRTPGGRPVGNGGQPGTVTYISSTSSYGWTQNPDEDTGTGNGPMFVGSDGGVKYFNMCLLPDTIATAFHDVPNWWDQLYDAEPFYLCKFQNRYITPPTDYLEPSGTVVLPDTYELDPIYETNSKNINVTIPAGGVATLPFTTVASTTAVGEFYFTNNEPGMPSTPWRIWISETPGGAVLNNCEGSSSDPNGISSGWTQDPTLEGESFPGAGGALMYFGTTARILYANFEITNGGLTNDYTFTISRYIIVPPTPSSTKRTTGDVYNCNSTSEWSPSSELEVSRVYTLYSTTDLRAADIGPASTDPELSGFHTIVKSQDKITSIKFSISYVENPESEIIDLDWAQSTGARLANARAVWWMSYKPGGEPVWGDAVYKMDQTGRMFMGYGTNAANPDVIQGRIVPNANATLYLNFANTTDTVPTNQMVSYSTVYAGDWYYFSSRMTFRRDSRHDPYQPCDIRIPTEVTLPPPAADIQLPSDPPPVRCSVCEGTSMGMYNTGSLITFDGYSAPCTSELADCLSNIPCWGGVWSGAHTQPTIDCLVAAGATRTSARGTDTPLPQPTSQTTTENTQNSVNTFEIVNGQLVPYEERLGLGEYVRTYTLDYLTNDPEGQAIARQYNFDAGKYGNWSGYYNLQQTGDRALYPAGVKRRDITTVDPNIYGFQMPLTGDRFVNATSQRVTGGKILPLAKPLTVVPRTPTPLRTTVNTNKTFSRVLPSNLGRTYRNPYYDPLSVGSSFGANGRRIQNIRNGAFAANTTDAIGVELRRPYSATVSDTFSEPVEVPVDYSPVDTGITYAPTQAMTIQPLDAQGEPAGPAAPVDLRQASPQVELKTTDFAGVKDKSEIYFGGAKVIIRGQDPLEDISSQINCQTSGLNSYVKSYLNPATGEYEDSLIIESCDSSPWSIANGCAGGELRQVGDFHVNKGFEQTRQLTSVYLPALPGSNGNVTLGNLIIPYTDSGFPDTGRLVDINFNAGIYRNMMKEFENDPSANASTIISQFDLGSLTNVPYPSMFPQETIIESRAGTGYQPGDRLRLIGGTPIRSNKGPLTKYCINDTGAGYIDPNKLVVQIGDGTTPGVGAVAQVGELNEIGGIKHIEIISYGVGYDPSRPPVISIYDNTPDNWASNAKAVSSHDQFSEVEISAGDIVYYTDSTVTNYVPSLSGTSQPTIEVTEQYFRVASSFAGVTLGGTANSVINSIDYTHGFGQFVPGEAEVSLNINASVGATVLIESSGTGANADIVNAMSSFLVISHGNTGGSVDYTKPIIYSSSLNRESKFDALAAEIATGNVTLTRALEFYPGTGAYSDFIPVVHPGIKKREPEIVALIGVDPNIDDADVGRTDINTPFIGGNGEQGYKALGGPLRVAKFMVTNVDSEGAITGLKILDRGLYKVFPSDLTLGIPLEYDYEPLGIASAASATPNAPVDDQNTLGGVDPLRNNILYGGSHPEYRKGNAADGFESRNIDMFAAATNTGDLTMYKHKQWAEIAEYKLVGGDADNPVVYYGTPGAYDPSTYIEIPDGSGGTTYLSKTNELDIDISLGVRGYISPNRLAGGRGARVFLTAEVVPDCSEKGTAKEDLGLPDTVREINAPLNFVNAANQGLTDVGYIPPEITWTINNPESPIPEVTLETDYPGVRFSGFEWMGIPDGDYNNAILCMTATLKDKNLTQQQYEDELEKIYNSSDAFGVTTETVVTAPNVDNPIPGYINQQRVTNTTLTLACVDSILTDPNSVFGDGITTTVPNITTITELYQYDITNIFGDPVKLDSLGQNVDVFYFHSKRYDTELDYNNTSLSKETSSADVAGTPSLDGLYSDTVKVDIPVTDKVWIDSYTIDDTAANIDINYPGFINGGWVYLEDGELKRWQTPMVDTKYIHNSLIYNPDTGERIVDLDFWDPFKGILPGFVRNEIHYISESDPVNYNLDRTMFGKTQVGKVWWDTSTLRYNWYEQGSNRERWSNWGSAFPGSTITICEWVESRAIPRNYVGDGTPRFLNQYITERHYNEELQQTEYRYYYWVQNRSVIDPGLRETQGRNFDTLTVARYIADPVNYGIPMISFLNNNSLMLTNIGDVIRDDDNHLQINLSRDLDPNGIKHSAWKLVREGDLSSYIPDEFVDKMIDSLASENNIGQVVPDPELSTVMRYGMKYRPRQTAFKDVYEARRTMAWVLNEIFADLNMYTEYPNWYNALPDETEWQYIKRATWYAVNYVDLETNEKIRYDDSYKPIFNVDNVSDLKTLSGLADGTVVQVGDVTSTRKELWLYNQLQDNFSRIAIQNDTIQLRDTVYTDETNSVMSLEIRQLLSLLNTGAFRSLNIWNELFFELMKYAYMEQGQLDWAFKSTYLYVDKNEQDLVQISGFKPDNYQYLEQYFNEVKPYHSKIREYKDGKSPPIETIGVIQPGDLPPAVGDCTNQIPCFPGIPGEDLANCATSTPVNPNAGLRSISDFDKPPYVDSVTRSVRILSDYNPADIEILSTDGDYVNYYSIPFKGDDPIRHVKSTITYDRTNWHLTQLYWNANTTPLANSIAQNISNIQLMSVAEVGSNVNTRAADRIFRMDANVQTQYARDILYHYPVYDSLVSGNSSIAAYPANVYVRQRSAYAPYELYRTSNVIQYGSSFTDNLDSGNLILVESPYDEISANVRELTNIISSGDLNFTLALVKTKVGGDYMAETLDANLFTRLVPAGDDYYDYETILGYDTLDYETFYWDIIDQVNNYVGIFKEPPTINLRRDDQDKEGFDGFTFKRVLYGEERPEELVYVDPFETLIINTYTNTETSNIVISGSDITVDANGTITAVTVSDELVRRSFGTVSTDVYINGSGTGASLRVNKSDIRIANIEVLSGGVGYDATTEVIIVGKLGRKSAPVEHKITYSLFGKTEYQRVRNKTTLVEDFRSWSEELVVTDDSDLFEPTGTTPGYVWVDDELIRYERKVNNVLSVLQRGQWGTTIEDHFVDTAEVYDGSETASFNGIDPERSVWLEIGAKYESLYNYDSDNYSYPSPNAPAQPGFDFGNANVTTQMCNATIAWNSNSLVTFTADYNITSRSTGVKIYADIDAGTANSQTSVQLLSQGYTGFDIRAQAISSGDVTGSVNGNITIVEYDVPLTGTGNISLTATIPATTNLHVVANVINNMGYANITAGVTSYVDDWGTVDLLSIRGFDFEITEIPAALNISTGRYSSEMFAVSQTNTILNTIRVRDDLFGDIASANRLSNIVLEVHVIGEDSDKIPFDYANVYAQTAVSLADRANADPRAVDSIMKFLHDIPTPVDNPPGFNP